MIRYFKVNKDITQDLEKFKKKTNPKPKSLAISTSGT